MAAAATSYPHTFEARLTLGAREDAEMVMKSLMVDRELQPDKVQRTMRVIPASDGKFTLLIQIAATEVRLLRPASSTLMDLAVACSKAIEQFKPSR